MNSVIALFYSFFKKITVFFTLFFAVTSEVQKNEQLRELSKNEQLRELSKNEQFRELSKSESSENYQRMKAQGIIKEISMKIMLWLHFTILTISLFCTHRGV